MTPLYRRLRACERFGLHPDAWHGLSTTMQTTLELYETLREAEEAREVDCLIAAGGA